MFAYSDPTGSGLLAGVGALTEYQMLLHAEYRRFARLSRSSFALLEAFGNFASAQLAEVSWIAFPRTAEATDQEIDEHRFSGGGDGRGLQDEYCEWRVEREGGRVRRVVFTTEFPEFFEACAAIGFDALRDAVRSVIPSAHPSIADFFGTEFNPSAATATVRQAQFRKHLPRNPWQNGEKSILCLQQAFNTLSALFNLVGECTVLLEGSSAAACTNAKFGACGPGRNSDPNVCTAVQGLRRNGAVVSLADPAGVRIRSLGGNWRLGGDQIDINDPLSNQGLWRIERNGCRAILEIPDGLRLANNDIISGAEVARALRVSATVVHAPEDTVPEWARTGQESSRQIV